MTDERNGNGNKSNINSNDNNTNSSPTSIANTSNNNNNANNSNNSASSSNNNNNNNERLIAEAAAKFLLKNGINGTNAAAAAATLLTAAAAAATFQLPVAPELKPPPSASAAVAVSAITTPTTSTASSTSASSNGTTPTLSSTKTNSSSNSSSLTMATASATALIAAAGVAAPKAPVDVMAGVLDYSAMNGPAAAIATTTKNSKFGSSGNGSSSSFDMGRHPISTHSNNSMSGYGGRLQFFKDGKFILELARAKEGDKGGWVSVPRKPFRTPSAATSATVTPTSAVTTTYPKNENSTSLSFSDDNSSIQSSPWQRDQPWKQTRPRRGISKELSLYYQRPRYNVLSQSARKAALRKRRRPHEPTIISEDHQSIFERVPTQENGDETLKAIEVDAKSPEKQSDEIKAVTVNEELTESKTESEAKMCSNDSKDENDVAVKSEAAAEKMNTSEDEDAMSVTVDEATPSTSGSLVNGTASELNGDVKVHKCEAGSDIDTRTTASKSTTITTTTDIRLKKQKPRAKLNSIIQKLIDGVPARLEQLSKTPTTGATAPSMSLASERSSNSSGGGAIGSLSHSLAHKVSPPSSAAAASRLVEYHHQSPRKRILREFEKVSLEDNNGCVNNGSGAVGGNSSGAGGKRSRAKGSSSSANTSSMASKSMPINLAPPQAKMMATPTTTTAVAAAAAATQPTRLNSSYSIHSLLGGSGSNSSSSKKNHDQPATIISNVHHPHHHSLYASSASYPRALLNSPKSPEMGGSNGGKSPSHATSKKQRSPPYAAGGSPLPIDYGRRTPPDNYKLAQAHAQQLQHSFYAPYVGAAVSPHIPQAGGGTRDLLSPPRSSSASPREPAAAGNTPHRTVPKKTASIRREFASPTASNNNSSSMANSCPSPGERSTSSPERRHLQLQRGSPSAAAAVAAGSPLHYYMYPPTQLNGSTVSPHGIAPNATPTTSSPAVAAAAAAAAAAAYIPSVVSTSLYHPYISTLARIPPNPLWVQHYQAGASPLLPPPPPHPQTSTAAGARLSPQSPYHPFGYNGVNSVALAVAAAAAASAFGQPTPNPHLGHPTHPSALSHHNTPPTHLAEHRTHTPKLTDICTDQMSAASSHRTNVSSSPASSSASIMSAGAAHGGGASGSGASSVQSAMFQNSSLRNELSSDLPLNLSKH